MTMAYWCALVTGLLPFAFAMIAKAGARDFTNRTPRAFLADLEGWRQRANWAQQNTFEALPLFLAGVIVAHQLAAPQVWVNALAAAFLGLRVLYGAAYIADQAALRSLVWFASLACTVALWLVGMA